MSTGIVYCSICKRELHQDGNRSLRNGWRHCEDRTPICLGGTADYPPSTSAIRGEWCGRDRGIDSRGRVEPVDHERVADQALKNLGIKP